MFDEIVGSGVENYTNFVSNMYTAHSRVCVKLLYVIEQYVYNLM